MLTELLSGLGKLFGAGAQGQASERTNQNQFDSAQDRTASSNYGTQQSALLNSLLASGRDKMSGYDTKQGATTGAMQGLQGATSSALANESSEKLQLAKLGMDAPTANARASILGSLMKNAQPLQFDSPAGQQGHLTKVRGGLSTADLDPMTRQQGEAMMQQALEKQLSGNGLPAPTDFKSGIQDWSKSVLDVPEATDYSKGLILPPELTDYKKPGKLESTLSTIGSFLSGAGAVGSAINPRNPYEEDHGAP